MKQTDCFGWKYGGSDMKSMTFPLTGAIAVSLAAGPALGKPTGETFSAVFERLVMEEFGGCP